MDQYKIDLNDYKKIKKLGKGQFGKVYLIENIKTHEKYASKVNNEILDEDEEEKASQLNEASLLVRLNNPSILKIKGYCLNDFKNESHLTMILEYMPNGNLEELINKLRSKIYPNEWTDTKVYINLLGIAIGMKYVHSQNIVQRDLKPENVLLDKDYYPVISDFGFSKNLNEMISVNLMKTGVGSLAYMAPEILTGGHYNYKVDVYSFAILAYELITLNSPIIKSKNVTQFIQKVVNGIRPSTSMIKDQHVVEFLNICWSNKPKERPRFSEIVELLEEKWFYSQFDVDENEIKEYLKRFEGESLKEDITEPDLSEVYQKSSKVLQLSTSNILDKDHKEQDAQNTSETEQEANDLAEPSVSTDLLDSLTMLIIENSIKEVFDRPIFSYDKIKGIRKSSPEDSLITPENINEAIQKKPYEDFIPTISFQLDKPLNKINYDKLQEVLGEDTVILNIESYHENLQNGFLLIENYEPDAKSIPTSLQIALLSIDNFDSTVNSKLDEYIAKLKQKVEENQSDVGNIVDEPKTNIPTDEDIKSVYKRPSINSSADYDEVAMNKLRQLALQKLRNDKNMYNWKFIWEHEDLYKQMNDKIREDLETNPYEMVMINQTIFPSNLLGEYENIKGQIPNKQVQECFLYSGSILKKDGFHGQGFYATEDPFLAAMDSNGSQILDFNGKTEIICCKAIYNKSKIKDLNSSCKGKQFDDDTKNNYGIILEKYIPTNLHGTSTINAHEYVFPNKIQLIPLCSFTVMRKDYYILWRDTNFINPCKFKNDDEPKILKKLSIDNEINVYIKYDSEDALNLITNKVYSPFKLVTNGGGNAKDFIKNARKRVGANFVCLVFANNIDHMDWICEMDNVLYSSVPKHFWEFVKLNMNLDDILKFESDLREYYEKCFKEHAKKFWNINRSELLNFTQRPPPPPSPSPSKCNLA